MNPDRSLGRLQAIDFAHQSKCHNTWSHSSLCSSERLELTYFGPPALCYFHLESLSITLSRFDQSGFGRWDRFIFPSLCFPLVLTWGPICTVVICSWLVGGPGEDSATDSLRHILFQTETMDLWFWGRPWVSVWTQCSCAELGPGLPLGHQMFARSDLDPTTVKLTGLTSLFIIVPASRGRCFVIPKLIGIYQHNFSEQEYHTRRPLAWLVLASSCFSNRENRAATLCAMNGGGSL